MQAETLFSSASGVHHTPADIIARARAVMNGIELDPASSAEANLVVKADRYYYDYYTYDEEAPNGSRGGLTQDWRARSLWLNPPFSIDKRDEAGNIILNGKNQPIRERVIAQWVLRWSKAVAFREVEHAMLLVPARTDTSWFQPLLGQAMCFVSGRLKFSDAENSAPFPTAIVYSGPNTDLFYTLFNEVGVCGRFVQT